MYYPCSQCEKAFSSYFAFSGHWMTKHKGEERPAKEDIEVEEAPEGFTLSVGASKEAKPKVEVATEPTPEVPEVEELPSDPPELFYTLLRLKGISDDKAKRLKQEFKLSKWMWGDAQEIQTLIRGAKLGVSSDWIRNFLKQYSSVVELPREEDLEFVPSGRGSRKGGRREFWGDLWGREEREDPLDRLLKYQLLRDTPKEEKEPGEKLSPVVDKRLSDMEKAYYELMDRQDKILEQLDRENRRREETEREEKLSARFAKIEEKLEREPKKEDSWLMPFLEERNKRTEQREDNLKSMLEEREKRTAEREERYLNTIEELTGKIRDQAEATAKLESRIPEERRKAIEERKATEEEVVERLKGDGWTGREKRSEERVMDLVESQVAPGIMREVRAGRELVEKALTGRVPLSGAPTGQKPVTPEEADKIGQLMEIESQLRGGAS